MPSSDVFQPNLSPKESVPSSEVTAMVQDDTCSHSDGKRAQSVERDESGKCSGSLNEEGDAVSRSPSRSVSASSGSELKYADGYISEKEENDSNAMEDEDNAELAVQEAHLFKIFKPENMDSKEPASILDLDFDLDPGEKPSSTLCIMGCSVNNSTGPFMRTFVSWTILWEGDQKLTLYVKDGKGLLIKLLNPHKLYEASVRDARIIVSFLELAMILRDTNAKIFLDHLEEKTGKSRGMIKSVLRKSYDSVVMKFLLLQTVPPSLRSSPIIRKMESVLKSVNQKKTNLPVSSMEGSSPNRVKRPNSVSLTKQVSVNKKRRIVVSDPEDGSDSEDHIPLAQRNFELPESPALEKAVSRFEDGDNSAANNDPVEACGSSEKHPYIPPGIDSTPPWSYKNNSSSRWNDGIQDFLDIAEIYGGQSDGPGDLGDDDVDDDDEELGDSAFCAICDDGGDLLFCDGPCMRSFHATDENGLKSKCGSLGFTAEQVADMGSWVCPSCKESKHQCFICGKLGRSEGKDKEVFVCDVALCGRFYHPTCLAIWKRKEKFNGITDMDAFIKGVENSVEEFCCPAHKCVKCGEGEEIEDGGLDNPMKLAKCRRCPRAYHRGCLPMRISFESTRTEPTRAWEIGKGLLIYCLDHVINTKLNTPERKHLMWPDGTIVGKKISYEHLKLSGKTISRPLKPTLKGSLLRKAIPRSDFPRTSQKQNLAVKPDKKAAMPSPVVHHRRVVHQSSVHEATRNPMLPRVKPSPSLNPRLPIEKRAPSLKPMLPTVRRADFLNGEEPHRIALQPVVKGFVKRKEFTGIAAKAHVKRMEPKVICAKICSKDPIYKERQKTRLLGLLQRSVEQVTLEAVKKTLEQPSCYGENKRKHVLHRGEFISILNAAKKAMEKIKNGGSPEDAKRLCPKDLFIQMLRAEDMLKVYLAPFLHGMRYTSFGRHFTCVEKLREIVERIHPYIESGDMIVDFCCGANDFSILLEEKLKSIGKSCAFLNFDIHPPKNGFCFSKGDWLKNTGAGFLEGKRLIMGLNPPFGVKAALATKFVEHALKFRPKLLVLIVPPETMSYSNDFKKHGYGLVWEDKNLLGGHAFYLPGSVGNDERENVTQWNVVPPPLYLWSEEQMIKKHRDIAIRFKHIENEEVSRKKVEEKEPVKEVSMTKKMSGMTNSASRRAEDLSGCRPLPSPGSSTGDRLSHSSTDASSSGHIAGSQHTFPISENLNSGHEKAQNVPTRNGLVLGGLRQVLPTPGPPQAPQQTVGTRVATGVHDLNKHAPYDVSPHLPGYSHLHRGSNESTDGHFGLTASQYPRNGLVAGPRAQQSQQQRESHIRHILAQRSAREQERAQVSLRDNSDPVHPLQSKFCKEQVVAPLWYTNSQVQQQTVSSHPFPLGQVQQQSVSSHPRPLGQVQQFASSSNPVLGGVFPSHLQQHKPSNHQGRSEGLQGFPQPWQVRQPQCPPRPAYDNFRRHATQHHDPRVLDNQGGPGLGSGGWIE